VRNLLNLLLEAPMDDATAQKMLSYGKQVSIYYQGDNDSNKGWKKIEPIRIEGEGDDKVMVAYEIEGLGKKPVLKKYVQKKITNWNVLSAIPATTAAKEKEKLSKEKPKKAPVSRVVVKQRKFTGVNDKICEAITNKRLVKMEYMGDEEEAPGWRTEVQPVCFGSRKGVNYVRAWVGSGKSVSGEKSPEKKALPGWRFFRVDRIKNWDVDSTKTFTAPPKADFNPKGDKLMDTIFCISDFAPDTPSGDGQLQEASMLSAIKEAINIF
jgi:predicted DNA-binding transcriptional regulator YafY